MPGKHRLPMLSSTRASQLLMRNGERVACGGDGKGRGGGPPGRRWC